MRATNTTLLKFMASGSLAFGCTVATAESLDFTAEHILEVPMDFRYSSLPRAPDDMSRSERRFSLGYGEVAGEQMRNRLPMFTVSQYRPVSDRAGWLFSLFYDRFDFSGSKGESVFNPTFGRPAGVPESFPVTVDDVSGSGYHAGGSVAYAFATRHSGTVALGLALSRLQVDRYRVDFTNRDAGNGFAGFVDYAGRYDAFAPYISWQGLGREIGSNWSGSPSVIFALPLPRTGFKGRLFGPNFDIQGDTDTAGNGAHIPDAYFGIGYAIEHRPSGVRIDLGATLFSWLVEPLVHRNIDTVLFLNLSIPLP